MEAQKRQEKRQAALKEKIDRQNKEREEKERVDRLIREQRQLEKSNAAIIALAEKKTSSDAEIQQMKEILRQLTMQEEEEDMEVQVIEQEAPLGAAAVNPPSNNNHRRRKSNKSSSAKVAPQGDSASRTTNVNAAKNAFFDQRQAFKTLQDTRRIAPVEYQPPLRLHCVFFGVSTASPLRPHCVPTASPLRLHCFSTASPLRLYCVSTASLLRL